MVQKRISNPTIEERISEPRYELGDILQELGTKCNLFVIEMPNGSSTDYGLVRLEFPDELLWKRLKSGLVIPGKDFIPDLQHHPYMRVEPEEAECYYKGRRIGHIDLTTEAIVKSADKPILHAFPELRRFYIGSGYFQ